MNVKFNIWRKVRSWKMREVEWVLASFFVIRNWVFFGVREFRLNHRELLVIRERGRSRELTQGRPTYWSQLFFYKIGRFLLSPSSFLSKYNPFHQKFTTLFDWGNKGYFVFRSILNDEKIYLAGKSVILFLQNGKHCGSSYQKLNINRKCTYWYPLVLAVTRSYCWRLIR